MKILPAAFQEISDCPEESNCPTCHKINSRVWKAQRFALDYDYDRIGLLKIIIGVYRCECCRRYFRSNPTFIKPRHLYTNKIVNIAIASAIEDGMPVSKIPQRLMRDFGIKPAESVIRAWIKKSGDALKVDDVMPMASREFSGVLCIDETYSAKLGILLACDPNQGDALVAFSVTDEPFDSEAIRAFLGRLRERGIVPSQVVTDGSALYPDVVKEIWPHVSHQLCLFHVNHRLANLAKKAMRKLRSRIPKDRLEPRKNGLNKKNQVALVLDKYNSGIPFRRIAREVGISRNTLKTWIENPELTKRMYHLDSSNYLEFIPVDSANPGEEDNWNDAKRVYKALGKLAYKISCRKRFNDEKVQDVYRIAVGSPFGNDVCEIREFIEQWYNIWWESGDEVVKTIELAKERWDSLAGRQLPESCQTFRIFQKGMHDGLFEKLTTSLKESGFVSTNNAAERYARRIKKVQKSRYRLRSKESLVHFIKLSSLIQSRPLTHDILRENSMFREALM